MTPRRFAAVQNHGPTPERHESGLRRAVNVKGGEIPDSPDDIETVRPPPPPAPLIPGLPTPAELQIAAAQRLTPLTPHLILRPQRPDLNPRPLLPPESVRRAFLSQMQEDAPKPPRLWPWFLVAFLMAGAGVLLGIAALYPRLLP